MLSLLPLLLCLAAAAATDEQQRKGLPESACIKLCEVTNKFCLNSCRPGPLGLACQGECGFKLGVCQGACIGFLPRQQETPGKLQFCMKTFSRSAAKPAPPRCRIWWSALTVVSVALCST